MSPDRRVDLHARERIEEIAQGYEKHTNRMAWYVRAGVALFFAVAVIFTLQQNALSNRGDETRQLSEANRRLGARIQIERARDVRDACEGQNSRHDKTIMVLDQQLAQIYLAAKGGDADQDKVRALTKRAKAAKTNQEARAVVLDAEKLLGKRVAAEMEQGRAPNAFLIDALAPVRDCDQLVHDTVGRRGQ